MMVLLWHKLMFTSCKPSYLTLNQDSAHFQNPISNRIFPFSKESNIKQIFTITTKRAFSNIILQAQRNQNTQSNNRRTSISIYKYWRSAKGRCHGVDITVVPVITTCIVFGSKLRSLKKQVINDKDFIKQFLPYKSSYNNNYYKNSSCDSSPRKKTDLT